MIGVLVIDSCEFEKVCRIGFGFMIGFGPGFITGLLGFGGAFEVSDSSFEFSSRSTCTFFKLILRSFMKSCSFSACGSGILGFLTITGGIEASNLIGFCGLFGFRLVATEGSEEFCLCNAIC